MEQLPNHIKIKILNYIPRRIHPCSIMVKTAFMESEACAYEDFKESFSYDHRSEEGRKSLDEMWERAHTCL
jgi:hypothetical protein